jgi:hypothetical protein
MNQIHRWQSLNHAGTISATLSTVRPYTFVEAPTAQEVEIDAMRRAFLIYGGLPSADEVLRLARLREDVPISAVAMPIAMRQVVSVAYRGALLLPQFQFEPGTLRVRDVVAAVISELRPVRDDWNLALWFALPSAALIGARPVDELDGQPLAIHAAARAERVGCAR